MADMTRGVETFRPQPLSHRGGKDKAPGMPGTTGGGFGPDRKSTPHKSHKLAKGLGLAGIAAVGGTAVYVGTQSGGESTANNTAVVTTVDVTQPPLTSPETTVITVSPTTETPPAIAERVFASQEQEEQVLRVEANIADFFKQTSNDLELYKNEATFNPYPDGFAPLLKYDEAPSYRALVENLGTITSVGEAGQARLHFIGIAKGDMQYVVVETMVITDQEIADQLPWHAGVRDVSVMNAIAGSTEYGTTNQTTYAEDFDHAITMPEALAILDDNPGQPMTIEIMGDPAFLAAYGYPTAGNAELTMLFEEVFELGSGEHTQTVLDKYSPEQLAAVGILKSPGQIPKEMLFYTSASQLLSRYPLNQLFTLFNGIPPISHNA